MEYNQPVKASEALSFLQSKMKLPTSMRTWALDRLPAELRERLAFSAAVTQAEFLDEAYSSIAQILSGEMDRATMRLELKRVLARLDYKPAKDEAGTLKDLSSDDRLNLILDTNVSQARGYAWHQAGQQEDLLDAFPAQEFLRVESRMKPRDNWKARWDAARAATKAEGATSARSGRMVALKNHPIWVKLSRFGLPYEPFDFNSGMGVEDVDRREAMQLGLIDLNTRIEPDKTGLNTALQASPTLTDDQLRKALEATGIGRFDSNGVFNLIRKGL